MCVYLPSDLRCASRLSRSILKRSWSNTLGVPRFSDTGIGGFWFAEAIILRFEDTVFNTVAGPDLISLFPALHPHPIVPP
jgi:hypothetical protein